MPSPYDYYLNPQRPSGVGTPRPRSMAPTQYGRSSSLFGAIRQPVALGKLTGVGIPQALLAKGLLSGMGNTANPFSFSGAKALVSPMNYKGFSLRDALSFGGKSAEDEEHAADQANRRAIEDWRFGTENDLTQFLRQNGPSAFLDLNKQMQKVVHSAAGSGNPDEVSQAAQANMDLFNQAVQQYLLGRERKYQAGKVDQWLMDPNRLGEQQAAVQQTKEADLSDLADQTQSAMIANAQNQARKGMQGSSVDAEARGGIGRTRDEAAAGIEQNAQNLAQQYRLGDQQQAEAMKGLIFGGDSNAGLSQMLASIQQQGQGMQDTANVQNQMTQAANATAQGYGNTFGRLLSGASKPVGYYVEHQGSGA